MKKKNNINKVYEKNEMIRIRVIKTIKDFIS